MEPRRLIVKDFIAKKCKFGQFKKNLLQVCKNSHGWIIEEWFIEIRSIEEVLCLKCCIDLLDFVLIYLSSSIMHQF